ncbi:MAG: tRNA pseudouridine(13) synthase TruD [Candidatus Micrarchaeota archaeon]
MRLSYLSKVPGIGGKLKSAPEDFMVEEISPDGMIYELDKRFEMPDEGGAYTHFILQKKDWSTASALSEIAKRLRTSQNNMNTAGTKDKRAVTTQLASVRGDKRQALSELKIKDISINGSWLARDRVHMGGLLGNRFTITVRDAAGAGDRVPDAECRAQGAMDAGNRMPDAEDCARRIAGELDGRFPNYFGEQRFGSTRRNTHKIGEMLLQGKTEDAAMSFLCDSEGEENPQARLARQELAETKDFSRALKGFPQHLRLERSMLDHLAKDPDDYLGALRRLPRNILLLFIHAFQSDIFNRLLSERIAEGGPELEEGEYFCGERHGFPDTDKIEAEGWITGKIIGYNTPLNGRERALLEELGVDKDSFRMETIPEISSKGTYRTLLAPLRGFSVSGLQSPDGMRFRFSLPSGSYATVAMAEFVKD